MAHGNYTIEGTEEIVDTKIWGVPGAGGAVDRVQRTDESFAAAAKIIEIESAEAMSLEGRWKSDRGASDVPVSGCLSIHNGFTSLSRELFTPFS